MANNPTKVKYPSQIDTSNIEVISDGSSPMRANDFNTLRKALLNVETELGINPKGSYSSVRARLESLSLSGLAANSVYSIHIVPADGTTAQVLTTGSGVKTGHIQNSAVTAAKIADLNVTTAKIANVAVTNAKLANDAVTTAKIADLNVTTAKIADLNVTTAKIADTAVTAAKIANGVVVRSIRHAGTGHTDDVVINEGVGIKIENGVGNITISSTVGEDGYITLQEAYNYGDGKIIVSYDKGLEFKSQDGYGIYFDGYGFYIRTAGFPYGGPNSDFLIYGPNTDGILIFYADKQTIDSTTQSYGALVLGDPSGARFTSILPSVEVSTWPVLTEHQATGILTPGTPKSMLWPGKGIFVDRFVTIGPNDDSPDLTKSITLKNYYVGGAGFNGSTLAICAGFTDEHLLDGYANLIVGNVNIYGDHGQIHSITTEGSSLEAIYFRDKHGNLASSTEVLGSLYAENAIFFTLGNSFSSEPPDYANMVKIEENIAGNIEFTKLTAAAAFDRYADITIRNLRLQTTDANVTITPEELDIEGAAVVRDSSGAINNSNAVLGTLYAEKGIGIVVDGFFGSSPLSYEDLVLINQYKDQHLGLAKYLHSGYPDGYAGLTVGCVEIIDNGFYFKLSSEDLATIAPGMFGGLTVRTNGEAIADSNVVLGSLFTESGIGISMGHAFDSTVFPNFDEIVAIRQYESDNIGFYALNFLGQIDGYAAITTKNIQHSIDNFYNVSGTFGINLTNSAVQNVYINGDTYFVVTGLAETSRNVSVYIMSEFDKGCSNITFDPGWRWVGAPPNNLLDGYVVDGYAGLLAIMTRGEKNSDIIAAFEHITVY